MIVLAALVFLAKRFAGSLRSNWRACEAFAQRRPGLIFIAPANAAYFERLAAIASLPPSLFARFSATVDVRKVYSVVGSVGNFRKAVGDSPKGARASPWPLLGTYVPCDGAASRASSEVTSVGVARSARGNPYQALHECAKAKVPLILRKGSPKELNK